MAGGNAGAGGLVGMASAVGRSRCSAWRGWKTADLPAGWHVAGGVLSKDGPVDDLVTIQSFGNFELELEWKMGKGGNSGLFYRGTREYDHVYWSGPEYQLLDDANAPDGGKSSHRRRGGLRALRCTSGDRAAVRSVEPHTPHREWRAREHWLNGPQGR